MKAVPSRSMLCEPLAEAYDLMSRERIQRVVLVEDQHQQGVISTQDVVESLAHTF